jgi:hypothetical protein
MYYTPVSKCWREQAWVVEVPYSHATLQCDTIYISHSYVLAFYACCPQAVIYLAVAILLDTRLGAHTTLMLRGLLARLTCSKNHRPAPGSGQTPAPTRAAGPNRDVESGQAVTQPLMLHRPVYIIQTPGPRTLCMHNLVPDSCTSDHPK